jgi:hypothetical protein
MQTKKVRDILPLRRAKAQEPGEETPQDVPAGRSVRSGKKRILSLLFLIILMAGIGGVLSLQFFFAKAQVRVWPYTREITTQARVTAQTDIATDEKKSILALVINGEKSLTRLFPATGTSTEQGRAKGTIRVFNGFSTFPQKLVAQTRFLSEDGKLFRSPEAVVIPAGRMEGSSIVAGSLDVEVVAAESGEEYNVGPSNFSLPGLFGHPAYTTITGKSLEPMTGGSKTEVLVVTEADLNAARDALVAELQQDVRESLESKVPEGMVLLGDAVDLQVAQAFSPIKAGAPLDNFNFSAKVQGVAIVFSRADVESAAQALAAELAEAGENIAEQSISIGYEDVDMNMSTQSLSFDMKVSLPLYRDIDPMEFKGRLAGLSKDEAALFLSEDSSLQKAEILLFPFWLEYLPQDPNKVEIAVVID